MIDICSEDECSDTCGRIRMYQALQPKQPEGAHIPGGRTVYRVMEDLGKCVTDMTGIKAPDGKWYVSAIFDCYDLAVLGLAMDTNMKAALCEQTLDNACKAYPRLRGAVLHSDRGTQYTSESYRKAINKYGIH